MARSNKVDALLRAAEEVVRAEGAARLTLDRVAQAAGVSKGGLLYHFPDRQSLLAAIVLGLVFRFEEAVADDDDRSWAFNYVRVTLDVAFIDDTRALLAVVAEDRSVLAPLNDRMVAWRRRLRAAARDPVAAEAAFLAADAVWYATLLGLPAPEGLERQGLEARLLKELDKALSY